MNRQILLLTIYMTAYWIWCAFFLIANIWAIVDGGYFINIIGGVCMVLGLFFASCLLDEILNAADE